MLIDWMIKDMFCLLGQFSKKNNSRPIYMDVVQKETSLIKTQRSKYYKIVLFANCVTHFQMICETLRMSSQTNIIFIKQVNHNKATHEVRGQITSKRKGGGVVHSKI